MLLIFLLTKGPKPKEKLHMDQLETTVPQNVSKELKGDAGRQPIKKFQTNRDIMIYFC